MSIITTPNVLKGAKYSRTPHSRNPIYLVPYCTKCDFCGTWFKRLWPRYMHAALDHHNEPAWKEKIMLDADKIIRSSQ